MTKDWHQLSDLDTKDLSIFSSVQGLLQRWREVISCSKSIIVLHRKVWRLKSLTILSEVDNSKILTLQIKGTVRILALIPSLMISFLRSCLKLEEFARGISHHYRGYTVTEGWGACQGQGLEGAQHVHGPWHGEPHQYCLSHQYQNARNQGRQNDQKMIKSSHPGRTGTWGSPPSHAYKKLWLWFQRVV